MLDPTALVLLRLSARVLAALLGGFGVFFLWASFYAATAGGTAVVLLASAGAIAMTLDTL